MLALYKPIRSNTWIPIWNVTLPLSMAHSISLTSWSSWQGRSILSISSTRTKTQSPHLVRGSALSWVRGGLFCILYDVRRSACPPATPHPPLIIPFYYHISFRFYHSGREEKPTFSIKNFSMSIFWVKWKWCLLKGSKLKSDEKFVGVKSSSVTKLDSWKSWVSCKVLI